jgi:hypothetical protein
MATEPQQIAEKSAVTSIQDTDAFLIQRGGVGGNYRSLPWSLIYAYRGTLADWAAGDYLTGQRRQYNNLQIEALDDFTSSSVETELEAATPKWKIVGGVYTVNTVANGETFVIPPNTTGISTELTVESGGTLTILTDGILANFGTYTNNGTINGQDRIQNKAL